MSGPVVCRMIERAVTKESMQRADAALKKEREGKRVKQEARKQEREEKKEKAEETRRKHREAEREAERAANHTATLKLQGGAGKELVKALDDSWLLAEFGDEAEGKSGKGKKAKDKQKKGRQQMSSNGQEDKDKAEDQGGIGISYAPGTYSDQLLRAIVL